MHQSSDFNSPEYCKLIKIYFLSAFAWKIRFSSFTSVLSFWRWKSYKPVKYLLAYFNLENIRAKIRLFYFSLISPTKYFNIYILNWICKGNKFKVFLSQFFTNTKMIAFNTVNLKFIWKLQDTILFVDDFLDAYSNLFELLVVIKEQHLFYVNYTINFGSNIENGLNIVCDFFGNLVFGHSRQGLNKGVFSKQRPTLEVLLKLIGYLITNLFILYCL